MHILGIDTSCDDTSVAIVQDWHILSNVIMSQDDIHQNWGGVVPNLARTAHLDNLPRAYTTALQQAQLTPAQIDAVAVTRGPGLAIALETGLKFAWNWHQEWQKPLYAVNHMEGHLLSSLIHDSNQAVANLATTPDAITLPALALLVSGGHTEIVYIKQWGNYHVLGETQDDALGEAFDKVARLLGFGYPGGAALAMAAELGHAGAFSLPIAMQHSGNYHVSYSGLKTAMVRLVAQVTANGINPLTKQQQADLAAAFQAAALTTILHKVRAVLDDYPVSALLLGGGVSANQSLQQQLKTLGKNLGIPIYIPTSSHLYRDNAAMIAAAGYRQISTGANPVTTIDQLDRLPRWRIDEVTV